jgi:1-deoxy-D-xylulose-5-phosphate reductoisomerase
MTVLTYAKPRDVEPKAGRPRRVTILGATGSIGESTLDLIGRDPSSFEVVALTGGRNAIKLAELAKLHRAKFAVIADEASYPELRDALVGTGIEAAAGAEALGEAASLAADWVMGAIVGIAGLEPTLRAVRQGTCTAIANKECLVAAGEIFMAEVARHKTTLLPVDSEHSAVFQVLDGAAPQTIEKVCLTASGGPFRGMRKDEMARVTPEQALRHPNWSMGAKITVDSATLMNKGLELIEARHLFGFHPDQLDILIHPQSVVHCLLYHRDGSVLAQLGHPDMRTPIACSLAWPERMHTPVDRLDLAKLGTLMFEAPDPDRFPALRVAIEALRAGGSATTVLNAANEIAVQAFLAKRIGYLAIAALVEDTLCRTPHLCGQNAADVSQVLAIDAEARVLANCLISRFA